MKKLNLKWSTGNAKLSRLNTVGFGLPAGMTCPGAGACKAICYAMQGSYTWRTVKAARYANWGATYFDDFPVLAIADLKRIKKTIVRVHDSGDFYSQAYVDAWSKIAAACPEKTFYAYTKSLHLDFSKLPSNFKLTQSMGGKYDDKLDTSKPHARIFESVEARTKAKYIDGNQDDSPAINGLIRIGLVYHGTKKLTKAQGKHFK